MKMLRAFSLDYEIVLLMKDRPDINYSREVNEFLKGLLDAKDIENTKDKALKVLKSKINLYENKVKEFKEAYNKRSLTAPLEEFERH